MQRVHPFRATSVRCPECSAHPGSPCTRDGHAEMPHHHTARHQEAVRLYLVQAAERRRQQERERRAALQQPKCPTCGQSTSGL
jgi:hypothetical protein